MNAIKQYTVIADPETGKWLSEPRYIKDVDVAEWDKLTDTPQVHYDCFEQCWACERAAVNGLRWHACECTSETRAIEVRWAYDDIDCHPDYDAKTDSIKEETGGN